MKRNKNLSPRSGRFTPKKRKLRKNNSRITTRKSSDWLAPRASKGPVRINDRNRPRSNYDGPVKYANTRRRSRNRGFHSMVETTWLTIWAIVRRQSLEFFRNKKFDTPVFNNGRKHVGTLNKSNVSDRPATLKLGLEPVSLEDKPTFKQGLKGIWMQPRIRKAWKSYTPQLASRKTLSTPLAELRGKQRALAIHCMIEHSLFFLGITLPRCKMQNSLHFIANFVRRKIRPLVYGFLDSKSTSISPLKRGIRLKHQSRAQGCFFSSPAPSSQRCEPAPESDSGDLSTNSYEYKWDSNLSDSTGGSDIPYNYEDDDTSSFDEEEGWQTYQNTLARLGIKPDKK